MVTARLRLLLGGGVRLELRVAGDAGGVLTPPVTRQHAAAAREEARGVAARASAPVRASMTVRDDGTVRLALRVKAEAGGVAAKASAVRASLTKPSTTHRNPNRPTLTFYNHVSLTLQRPGEEDFSEGVSAARLRRLAARWRAFAKRHGANRALSVAPLFQPSVAAALQRFTPALVRVAAGEHINSAPMAHSESSLRSRCNAVALVFMAELSIPYGLQTNQRNVDMWLPLEFREKIEHSVRATHLEQGGRWSASNKRMPCDVLDQLAPWALESILTVDPKYLRACLHADESAGGLFSPSARPQRLSRRIRDPNVARERLAGRRYAITLRHPAKRQRYSIGSSDELASQCAVVNLTELAVHV